MKQFHFPAYRRGGGRMPRSARLGALAVLLVGALVVCAAARVRNMPVGCTNEDLTATEALALATAAPADSGADPAPEEEKVVYLTFDDGPSKTTEKVLDVLKTEGVPATFFVIAAENNEKYLSTLQRTVSEGHLVALHSCSHEYHDIYASPEAYWQDIEQLKQTIAPYVPYDCAYLRFPGGSTNTVSRKYGGSNIMKDLKAQAVEKGYTYVDWNVCADDAVGGHPSAQTIYENVVRDVGKKHTCVVLMHDTNATKNTAAALPDIIKWFKNAGYRFDTVDHLQKQI